MTIILKRKEYKGKNDKTYFVEKYMQKEWMQPMWRYGVINEGRAFLLSDELWTRPNLKKLHLI